jgi:cupin fold WbuC family metalloprotein
MPGVRLRRISAAVRAGLLAAAFGCDITNTGEYANKETMKLITQETIDGLILRATEGRRRRSNYNLHPVPEDPVQRLLVAAKIDSYFRPHKHETKWECAVVLQGAFDVFIFDDDGVIIRKILLGKSRGALGFEIEARVWHGWVPVEDDGVFFEVKQGPYDPSLGTTFAPWAPPEGDPGAPAFLARLRSATVGDRIGT